MSIQTEMRWSEGFQFIGRAGKGPAVVLDSMDGGSGPSPMQIILMGLTGCAGIDVVSILKKRRSPFTGMRIKATGERAETPPRRYTRIIIEFEIFGRGINPKDVQRAVSLSLTKYCSVAASLNADIQYTYRIDEEEPAIGTSAHHGSQRGGPFRLSSLPDEP